METKSLAIVCTINNDREHTLAFVKRVCGKNLCRLFLFLDDSEHLSYIENGLYSECLTVIPCTKDYWKEGLGYIPTDLNEKQHFNIEKGAAMARKANCSWCLSIDSDELVYNLPELLSYLDAQNENTDLLRLLPAELIHDHQTAFNSDVFLGRYFKLCLPEDILAKSLKMLRLALRIRFRILSSLTRRQFFGHINGKTIFRLSLPITTYKQHRQYSDVRKLKEVVLPDNYLLLHYDAMNYTSWLEKWRKRISGYTEISALSNQRRKQARKIKNSMSIFSKYRTKRLFTTWYVFNEKDITALIDSGAVKEIQDYLVD